MTPSQASGTNHTMELPPLRSEETPTAIYEDFSARQPPVVNGAQSEVEATPVPRPRTKTPSNRQCSDTNNTMATYSDITDKTTTTTTTASSSIEEQAKNRSRSHTLPPPRPPAPALAAVRGKSLRASVDRTSSNHNTMKIRPPRPPPCERPPPPPSPKPPSPLYCDRLPPLFPTPKTDDGVNQVPDYSPLSPITQTSASTNLHHQLENVYATYSEIGPNRPVPAPRQMSLPNVSSRCEASPPQSRTDPPVLYPPLPDSSDSSESLYSEIDLPEYLEVLPAESEDIRIPGRVKWLKRMSRLLIDEQYEDNPTSLMALVQMILGENDFRAPSQYGLSMEEEMRSFNRRAEHVTKALGLYNDLLMTRREKLKNIITEFNLICEKLDKIQKKNKTITIAGGTTGAVGGMTALMGLAFAPITLGGSLIATVVGAGMVASAGGMGAHAAKANKKIATRTTVENLVSDYRTEVVDLELCLNFILGELNELRRHDVARLHRSGAELDSLKIAHKAEAVFRSDMKNCGGTSAVLTSDTLLQAFAKEMPQYFSERNGEKLKKSNKSRFSGRLSLLANNLNDELTYLTDMWDLFNS